MEAVIESKFKKVLLLGDGNVKAILRWEHGQSVVAKGSGAMVGVMGRMIDAMRGQFRWVWHMDAGRWLEMELIKINGHVTRGNTAIITRFQSLCACGSCKQTNGHFGWDYSCFMIVLVRWYHQYHTHSAGWLTAGLAGNLGNVFPWLGDNKCTRRWWAVASAHHWIRAARVSKHSLTHSRWWDTSTIVRVVGGNKDALWWTNSWMP